MGELRKYVISSFAYAFKWPYYLLTSHFLHLFTNLDPIKDCASEKEVRQPISALKSYRFVPFQINIHYILPLCVMAGIQLDSLYILFQNEFVYDPNGLKDLYTHKYFPNKLWLQGSAIVNWGVFLEVFTYARLIFDPLLDTKYTMYAIKDSADKSIKIICNGKLMNERKSDKIYNFRSKAKAIFKLLIKMEVFQVILYFGYQVYLHWENTARDVFLAFFLPVFTFYAVYGAINLIYYFLLSARYLWIKQAYHLEELSQLTIKLIHSKGQRHRQAVQLTSQIWDQYRAINRQILALFDEFHAYNRFWSFYITSCFVSYVVMICYLCYGLLNLLRSPGVTYFMLSFFIFFLFEFVTILQVICGVCSFIVNNNVKIYKQNLKFCYIFGKYFKPTICSRLQMDKKIANFRGTRIGFRLLNNLIIDSKMFELIFFYISTLFLKIFK